MLVVQAELHVNPRFPSSVTFVCIVHLLIVQWVDEQCSLLGVTLIELFNDFGYLMSSISGDGCVSEVEECWGENIFMNSNWT